MNKDVECVHGLNPVFEVMRAGRRQVREVLVNQVQRDVSRVQKLKSSRQPQSAMFCPSR